jgi:multidrug efflux pump subunit AcrB
MNFSAWSVRRPVPAVLLFIALTLGGAFSFRQLRIESLPDLSVHAALVTVVLPAATPSQIETEVTRKVEGALSGVDSIQHIRSRVAEGVSQSTIEFRPQKDMREAMEEVRNAMDGVRSKLPAGVRDPSIEQLRAIDGPILTYAVESSDMDEVDLSWFVDDAVSKALLGLPGVGAVTRNGGVTREILVELDPLRLQSLDLTVADVSDRILAIQQDTGGGYGKLAGGEQSLRSVGRVGSVAELEALQLSQVAGKSSFRVGDIATVRDTSSERTSIALRAGRPVVSFQVEKAQGASEIALADRVRAMAAQLRRQYPDVWITEVNNTVDFTQTQYDAAMRALLEGGVLTLIVVWLFLRDRRATAISAVALPLSVLPTFLVMYWLGYTLNTVTLLALTLIVGVLVDDAIVEVENIVRHLNMGKTPMQAALDATQEIGLAVIATSFALLAVFLPTTFITVKAGRIFQEFGGTTSVAVIGSLLAARLLTPMMAAYLLRHAGMRFKSGHTTDGSGWLMRRYLAVARWCLAHPYKTSVAAGAAFILSILLAASLSFEFMPADNTNQITVTVTAPPGESLEGTAALVERIRVVAAGEPEVESVFATVGAGAALEDNETDSRGDLDKGTVVLTLKPRRKRTQQQVEASLRERLRAIAGARFAIGNGESGENYSIGLAGNDLTLLQATAVKLAAEMRELRGFGTVTTSADLQRPEVIVRRDPVKASDLGVSTQAISQVVRIATGGEDSTVLPKLDLPSRQVPIRIRLDDRSRHDLDTLAQLRVPANGGTVPLSSVATLAIQSGPSVITRLDRTPTLSVDMELNGRPFSDAEDQVDVLPTLRHLPVGISRVALGDAEAQQDLMSHFLLAIGTGILCVYVVLVLLFNDFLQPITILSALPLSAAGAFAALWICGFSVSLPSMIGVIMLMGLVSKNAILLVDYAILARRDHGLARQEAILDACHKRARPIVMTTVAMVAGMLPVAVTLQGDSSFRAPMAVVVIGGLLSSTLLSLLVVPVVYELVDHWHGRGRLHFPPVETLPPRSTHSAAIDPPPSTLPNP